MLMNVHVTRAAAVALPAGLLFHALPLVAIGMSILALLVYVGIALPAVWSAKPARRKAAAEVLRQIFALFRSSG